MSPWIRVAIPRATCDRASGRSIPRCTGIAGSPIQSNTRKVFSVVKSMVVLPLTLVAPISSRSGESAATISATASSVPVSTSRMTFVAMPEVCPISRPRGSLREHDPGWLGAS